jgi:peptide/nickel transport system substrate-binding protein
VWTLKLRPDTKFSDGTPFDAEAVKFNWDRVLDAANRSPSRPAALVISSLTVVDPTTLKITLSEARSQFNRIVAFNLAFIGSPTALRTNPTGFAQRPIGAGPFTITDRVLNNQTTMARNPNYWNKGRPYLDQLIVKIVPDEQTRYSATTTGQMQLNLTSDANILATGKAAGFKTANEPLNGGSDIIFNNSTAPFNDVRVRRAFAMAIDPKGYSQAVEGGHAIFAPTMFKETSQLYTKVPLPKYNPKQAQKLFNDVARETGKPVTFTLGASSGGGRSQRAAEYMQSVMASFQNVQMSVDVLASAVVTQNAASGNFQALSFTDFFVDPEPLLANRFQSGLSTNYTRFANADFDAALKIGQTSLDVAERRKAYETAQRIFAKEVPTFIYARSQVGWLVAKQVNGVTLAFDGTLLTDRLWLSSK